MYVEHYLGDGEILKLTCKKTVWMFKDNGKDIDKVESGLTFSPPVFEIACDIPIFIRGETEPKLTEITASLNNAQKEVVKLKCQLSDRPHWSKIVMSGIRTPWYALPNEGTPKGPAERCKTMKDLVIAAQSHNCQKRRIASYDDPINRMLGFACMCGRKWQIGLMDLKTDLDKKACPYDLNTAEARIRLSQAIQSMQAIPEVQLNKEMEPGDGLNSSSITYFTNRSMFGWDGDMSDLEFVNR